MGVLTATTRHQLLDLLCALPLLDSRSGRDTLLQDLPLPLRTTIPRSETTRLDLDAIVYAADNWWPPGGPGPDYPLRLLVQTVANLADGSQSAAAFQAFLAALPATLDPSAHLRCPYPGMVPFSPDDARFFYGREPEIAEMLRRLRVGRYLLVIGPSGSGKSSLVTAGLLPTLERQQPGNWHTIILRPGPTPITTLAQALGGDVAQPAPAVPALLAAQPSATRLLIIVDSFEELFTQADRTAQATFLTALTALRAVSAATLVLLMRADFYPDLMQSPLWPPGEGERLEIAPLQGDALRAAITKPAADVGVEVEPDLVERLVADAADEPGSLPLLQEALVLLWDGLQGRALRLADYAALGQDGRSGLAVALATRSDATYNSLTAAQQGVARRIFLRLVAFGEGRPDTRRQQAVAALQVPGEEGSLFASTLATLTDHRLLTTSGEGQAVGARRVDIAHEALIQGWPLLQGWIGERQAAEQTRRRLEEQAAAWVRLGSGHGGLLDEAELPEAEHWLAAPDRVDLGASDELVALVIASRTALEAEEQSREGVRQRELAQAHALAVEQQRRADEQALAAHRLRLLSRRLVFLLGGTSLMLLLAIGLGLLAVQANEAAQHQTRVARSQALAANAVAQLDVDPERSVLLAMEAVSTTRRLGEPILPEAVDALHAALLRFPLHTTLYGHTSYVYMAAWSPDGRGIVTASDDGTARIWIAPSWREDAVLRGHSAAVHSAIWSPNGQQILTASADGTARVWDAKSGQSQLILHTPGQGINAATWSPDGTAIATGGDDTTVRVWDSASGRAITTLQGHTRAITSVLWSPDGQHLASTGRDGTVWIWEIATGRVIATYPGNAMAIWSTVAAWSPDGQFLLSSGSEGTATVWELTSGKALRSVTTHTLEVTALAWSPDGRRFVTASENGTASVWNLADGQELATFRAHANEQIHSVAWSRDGRLIMTASEDATTRIWDAETGQQQTLLSGHVTGVTSASWSPDGRRVVTSSYDGTTRVWVIRGQEWPTLYGHTGEVYAVAWSPDSASIATTGEDGTARIWDAVSGELRMTLRGDAGSVLSVSWSPDGRRLVTAGEETTTRIWDVSNGQTLTVLQGHTDDVNRAAWSPDGQLILTSGLDRGTGSAVIRVWDAATSLERVTLQAPGVFYSAAWSPDGHYIAAGGLYSATIWDVATGKELYQLYTDAMYPPNMYDVAWSPNGRWLAAASSDSSTTIWYAMGGAAVATLHGHTDEVLGVVWSPDGHLIATASRDGTAKLWDAEGGQTVTTLHGLLQAVSSVAWSPNGRVLATGSWDGTVRQYVVQIKDLMDLAASRVTRALTPEERATYLGEALPTPTLATSSSPVIPGGTPTPGP